MTVIEVCSGIGGFSLGFRREGFRIVGHSEVEKFPCEVYHHHFPESECLGDINKIKWKKGQADILCGGIPCQGHSVAGKRLGGKDERNLWPAFFHAVGVVRPRYAIIENVPGFITSDGGRFFNRVVSDLASIGYDCEWDVISAADFGAPHLRKRIWIVAYAAGIGLPSAINGSRRSDPPRKMANSLSTSRIITCSTERFIDEVRASEFVRTANGISHRVDRVKALGNSLVPQIAQWIAARIREREEQLRMQN